MLFGFGSGDPSELYNLYYSGASNTPVEWDNAGFYSNETVDDNIDKALLCEDEEEAFIANPSTTVGMSSTELSNAFFTILIDRCKDITISIRCDSIHVSIFINSFIV